ncbi:MAG: C4-dicarboxylate ABC transporter substrate-binding protein [Deltaproteobacteria bacterium HGW-Deltaproteobacteria-18]|jgi:C4-dicarboxylate-binding protein DctP|nr:MAG: C4-dicarboxylate ABC transporter substrate-binding protein [Deltaproteobacteria bacterium HGW-Deltaproteobacteria-18]
MRIVLTLLALVLIVSASTPAPAATWKMRFGHDQTEQSPHQDAALYLKKLIEEGSEGDIEVTVYPNQLLGTGVQMVEMARAGAVEMIAVPTARIQVVAPAFQLLDLPFLFPTKQELYDVLFADLGRELFKTLESNNLHGLTYWGMGFKQFTGNFPIHAPADFKGKKIRVMPSPVIREQFLALGASPVSIDFHELYNALQQGVVDGQENPLVGITTMKLYEVQKHMTLSNHAFLAYGVVVNKSFFDALPDNYQTLLTEAAAKSSKYELDLIEKRDQGFLDTIIKAGVEVSTLTPSQTAAFQEALKPVYDWFRKNVEGGAHFLDMLHK